MKKPQLLLVAFIFAACNQAPKQEVQAPVPAAPSIDEAKTKEVLEHHFQAFKQNDLDAVMADYTEESVMVTPDRTATGLTGIRENFTGAFQVLPTNGTTITPIKTVIAKDVAYVIWKATTPTLEFKYATDTFIIQDGKIVRQTYAGDVAPIAKK